MRRDLLLRASNAGLLEVLDEVRVAPTAATAGEVSPWRGAILPQACTRVFVSARRVAKGRE
jgi:hypothetical protein